MRTRASFAFDAILHPLCFIHGISANKAQRASICKLRKKRKAISMPITEMLAHNAYVRGNETALVEVNPAIRDDRGVSWREFELVETNPANRYRRRCSSRPG